jgi:signal transduction histidine kinase
MRRVQENFADTRAHTDASLGAERASTDAASDRTLADARRMLDDLIEHDRNLADERLLKLRDVADSLLTHKRSEAPARDSSVAVERQVADDGIRAEREATDAFLGQERLRADASVETERRDHEADRVGLEERRRDTDQQLSTERTGADVAFTALHRTTDDLGHARRELANSSDVLAMVTHDLRSPLSVIVMNAQFICDLTKEAPTREAGEDVRRAAARIGRMLADLLDVARIESGTLCIVERPHDVSVLLTELLQSYQPLFADRGITFVVEVPGDAVVASFDYDRVVQVLSNLLGNAMKFVPSAGTVELHVERRAGGVEFVLRDNGPGIHPNALPNVFRRFWQVDSDKRRGLGLGLYICQKIVEAHAGRIWIENDFGKGATFRFTLPDKPGATVSSDSALPTISSTA